MRVDGPNLDLLGLLGHDGSSDLRGGGLLDHRTQLGFLLGEGALELQVRLHRVGFRRQLAKFRGLLLRTLGHVGQFGHPGGDRRGTVLKSLEVARHFWPCSLLSRPTRMCGGRRVYCPQARRDKNPQVARTAPHEILREAYIL